MEFKNEIDAFKFIMDMETYVSESPSVPFTNRVMVDKDIMYDYFDQLRTRLPKEMREYQRLYEKQKQKEAVQSELVEENEELSETQASQVENIEPKEEKSNNLHLEKDTTIQIEKIEAEEKAKAEATAQLEMIDVVQKQMQKNTEEECRRLLIATEKQAQEIMTEAYDYANKIMEKLQSQIGQQIEAVKDGRVQIEQTVIKLNK